jgi:hypothetical protein
MDPKLCLTSKSLLATLPQTVSARHPSSRPTSKATHSGSTGTTRPLERPVQTVVRSVLFVRTLAWLRPLLGAQIFVNDHAASTYDASTHAVSAVLQMHMLCVFRFRLGG